MTHHLLHVDSGATMRDGPSMMRIRVSCLANVLAAAVLASGGPSWAGSVVATCIDIPDGTPCDDGDPCTTDDACLAAACVGDASGTCWSTRSIARVVASGSAGGRTARCSLKCEVPGTGTLILGADGIYRVPSGSLVECPSGATTFPDEVGTILPKRRRTLVLQPDNLDELFAAAADCVDEINPFRTYRSRVKLSRDGTTLKGKVTLRGRVPGRIPIRVKATARMTGADVQTGLEPPPPSRKTLPECSEFLQPRCRVD